MLCKRIFGQISQSDPAGGIVINVVIILAMFNPSLYYVESNFVTDPRDSQNGIDHVLSPEPVAVKEGCKTPPNGSCVPAIFTINQLKRKFDSVDNIMDRIDEGISTLRKIEVQCSVFCTVVN